MTSYARLTSIAAAIQGAANDYLEHHDLPTIDTITVGITEVLGDMSAYPALLVAEKGRSYESPYWTTYNLLIGVAVRHDDMKALNELGESYVDAIEHALKHDCTLGGYAITSRMQPAEVGCVSGIYVAAFELTCDVDTGGIAHQDYDDDQSAAAGTETQDTVPDEGDLTDVSDSTEGQNNEDSEAEM